MQTDRNGYVWVIYDYDGCITKGLDGEEYYSSKAEAIRNNPCEDYEVDKIYYGL